MEKSHHVSPHQFTQRQAGMLAASRMQDESTRLQGRGQEPEYANVYISLGHEYSCTVPHDAAILHSSCECPVRGSNRDSYSV